MSNFSREDERIIQEYNVWFNFFLVLPKWVTIISAILYAIGGIVLAIVYEEGWIWLAVWGGGAIICGLTYVLLKITASYQILHIYYLKKLSSTRQDNPTTQVNDQLPKI